MHSVNWLFLWQNTNFFSCIIFAVLSIEIENMGINKKLIIWHNLYEDELKTDVKLKMIIEKW